MLSHLQAERTWKHWKASLKNNIIITGTVAEAHVAFSKHCIKLGATTAKYPNIAAARKALQPLGFHDEEYFQWACVPDNPASREAYLWLFKFFTLIGENTPNRKDKIQLPGIYTKESIHKIYHHHVTTIYSGNEHEPLERRAFESLWLNIFPNVTISRYCQVSGKCFSCHALYLRQEIFSCEADLITIRKLATIHKILIEMQRGAYMENRQQSQERPDLAMSCIIDGMAQDHCILPSLAGEDTPSCMIKQKIVGAKQHGIGRSFYRLFPHIKSGANVACEVLLHEIERRLDHCLLHDVPFPRILYLQLDGGPENTSKSMYALTEHLVRSGVFDRIELARLPVGHTHEDIDAMFGVLWRAAQGKTIITPQQWKDMALSAFNQV